MKLTHLDLFSGIGGFALAARANGLKTEVFCESDERCQAFLKKAWPGVPIVGNVREFDGTRWPGATLLTAGVPCQPASRAGKQRGKDDDRWLWPEALRVLEEARPTWALFENPPGIGDVGLDEILAEMEAQNYEVGTVDIPACALNTPHLRHRYWILAHSTWDAEGGSQEKAGTDGKRTRVHVESGALADSNGERLEEQRRSEPVYKGARRKESERCGQGDVANAASRGQREHGGTQGSTGRVNKRSEDNNLEHPPSLQRERLSGQEKGRWTSKDGSGETSQGQWDKYQWIVCADGKFRRAPDDSFGLVNGLHRSVLKALGNSIVPQVAAEVIRAIKEAI